MAFFNTNPAPDMNLLLPNGQAISDDVGGQWQTQATSGAINPHVSGTYFITKAGVEALTVAAPTAGTDDGIKLVFYSTTNFAHTITATGLLATGSASVNAATFAAFAGARLTMIAYQGLWYTAGGQGTTFS